MIISLTRCNSRPVTYESTISLTMASIYLLRYAIHLCAKLSLSHKAFLKKVVLEAFFIKNILIGRYIIQDYKILIGLILGGW